MTAATTGPTRASWKREFLKASGAMGATWAFIGAVSALVLMRAQPPQGPAPAVRAVEAPPEAYTFGPTLTGQTYEIDVDDMAKVDYLCRLALGPAWPPGGYWMGCYNGKLDAVIVPAAGILPSEAERQALIVHEWAHARGWAHQNDGRFGRPRGGTIRLAIEPQLAALPPPKAPQVSAR